MKGRKKTKAENGGNATLASDVPVNGGHRGDPTPEEIARRAYEIYESRGGAWGSPDEDWLRAERELRAAKATQTARP